VEDRTAYLWIVPAKVAGVWTWPKTALTLNQGHQKIAGTLKLDAQSLSIANATLSGNRISFVVGDSPSALREYSGYVIGNTIQGTVKIPNGPEVKWVASRAPAGTPKK